MSTITYLIPDSSTAPQISLTIAGANSCESIKQRLGNEAATSFESYEPSAVPAFEALASSNAHKAVETAVELYHAAMEAAAASQPSVVIDGGAVVAKIANEWEKAGVDPAWVAVIRDCHVGWPDLPESKQPPLIKLIETLKNTVEFDLLRSQAINVVRHAPDWKSSVDARVNREPTVSRAQHEYTLLHEKFDLKENSPAQNIEVLSMILSLSDKWGPSIENNNRNLAWITIASTLADSVPAMAKRSMLQDRAIYDGQ